MMKDQDDMGIESSKKEKVAPFRLSSFKKLGNVIL